MDSLLKTFTDRIHAAAADRTPLRIRGGGSKDFYGESLQGEVLDVAGYCGITSYEPSGARTPGCQVVVCIVITRAPLECMSQLFQDPAHSSRDVKSRLSATT